MTWSGLACKAKAWRYGQAFEIGQPHKDGSVFVPEGLNEDSLARSAWNACINDSVRQGTV
jgi:hypothetical protein